MKYLLFIILIFFTGCFGTTTYQLEQHEPLTPKECRNVPEIWWGEKGEDPSGVPIWLCYPWVLEAR